MERRCQFWLPKKNRFCANVPITNSLFCGNHTARSDGHWIACPIDPSHTVLKENLEGHLRRCPLLKHVQSLSLQPYYQKGINAGKDEDDEEEKQKQKGGNEGEMFSPVDFVTLSRPSFEAFGTITSEMKRNAVYSMTATELSKLISKIRSVHASICTDIQDSYKIPEACGIWINREIDRKLPFQEKHVVQQASILGNLENFGVLTSSAAGLPRHHNICDGLSGDDTNAPAVVEFGAGRGYLTQMLADCYGINKVFLVERKSYKLKADRSLRQKESLILERLRIDIEDLKLNAVDSLQGIPYLAIGKHLCGPATDKRYLSTLGIRKEDFHAITWFTSWAVDADHSSDPSSGVNCTSDQHIIGKEACDEAWGAEEIFRDMKVVERAMLGFMCKDIIDAGRLMWVKEQGLDAQLVKYVPSNISPENHLLIANGDCN